MMTGPSQIAGRILAVFLDRDGTINVDRGYVHRADDWEFAPGAMAALRQLRDAGFLLAIATNQAGISAGRFSVDDVQQLHSFMQRELVARGAAVDAIEFCSHPPGANCNCRKPATGMARRIEDSLGYIDYARSWTVGDKPSDVEFGRRLGTRTALIRSHYWSEGDLLVRPSLVVDSLLDMAQRTSRRALRYCDRRESKIRDCEGALWY